MYKNVQHHRAVTLIPSSFNCASLTGVGASTIRSTAFAVLGNGMTSRRLSAPAREGRAGDSGIINRFCYRALDRITDNWQGHSAEQHPTKSAVLEGEAA